MNERQAELTSALLDGELDPQARQQVVTKIAGLEQEELQRFGRYCLIGDAIRGESTVLAVSVAEKVREALADEPVVLAPNRRQPRAWVRPVAGLAVAASVAAAAVVLAPQLMSQTEVETESVQVAAGTQGLATKPVLVAAGPTDSSASTSQVPAGERWQALNRNLEDRLNRLIIEHQEFGGRTGINGPVAHIGLVSYGAR